MNGRSQKLTVEAPTVTGLLRNVTHHNLEESPQSATRETVPLTQEDVPRIIEGVIKLLTEIDSRREPTTSDHAPTSIALL